MMQSIKNWCDRKFDDVVTTLGTDNVSIHVHAYQHGIEYVVCDFFDSDTGEKFSDTTIAFGDDTQLDDLTTPHTGNVLILFELLEEIAKRFTGKIQFGMPEPAKSSEAGK